MALRPHADELATFGTDAIIGDPMNSNVVTRFAPSPTGYLHVGGARTALFCWLLSRHHGGTYLLRIEDTDAARSTQASVDSLLEDLKWLGLRHDNADSLMYQSARVPVYNKIIEELISRGLAYKAYETPAELDAMRKQAEQEKRSFIYRRRPLSDEQVKQYIAENRPHVVRFAMPVQEYRFHDVVLDKEVVMPAEEAQDFVIRKADGMPTYHFAVVVDDAELQITHVLRGQEHLKNTFYHIALQRALEYPRPIFAHLPVILNVDGSKMSKRDRDKKIRHHANLWIKNTKKSADDLASESSLVSSRIKAWLDDTKSQLDLHEQLAVMRVIGLRESDLPEILVHDFRKNGYLPEVLLNFLALLGWNPGGDRERMSMAEMEQLFRLEDVGKSNAKFDREKLLAFNIEALSSTPTPRLVAALREYLAVNPNSSLNAADDASLGKLFEIKKGYRTLREVDEMNRFFFTADDQITYDVAAVEKVLRKQNGAEALREVRDVLASASDWSTPSIEQSVQQFCEQKQLGLGKVAQPIRIAISGTTVSPPLFQSLELLGKDRTIWRIDRCLQSLT